MAPGQKQMHPDKRRTYVGNTFLQWWTSYKNIIIYRTTPPADLVKRIVVLQRSLAKPDHPRACEVLASPD